MVRKSVPRSWCGEICRGVLALLFFLASLPVLAQAGETNTIGSIKTVKDGVDIEVHSTRFFPVRNELVVLRIGRKEFTKSRSPQDGNLNTLIFTLTSSDFEAETATGDDVFVQFGRGEGSDRRYFGKLDKSKRDKN